MPLPLPFPGAFSRGAGGVQAETLAFPEGVTFPVTLQRTATEYRVLETAASFDDYTGDTIFVATTGNDTTGDGSSGAPYLTLDKAITEASSGDIISMAAGIYATPSATITKNLKFTAPSGGVFIGALEDVSGETFTLAGDGRRWTITAGSTSTKWRGFVRLDDPGVFLDGFVDQHLTTPATDTSAMSALGIPCMVPSASTAVSVIYLGGANPNTLAAAGDLLMWRETATASFEVSANVWIGSGITIANVGGTSAFGGKGAITINSGQLVLDGTKVFGGGAGPTISNPNDGVFIAFGATISGSTDDLIDGRGTSTNVEVNCNVVWGGIQAAGNTSTMHDSAKSLRVGGTYYGACRTVHDINTTRNFIFSCTLGEVIAGDKQVLRVGLTTDLTATDYGDLTFVNTIGVTGVTNLTVDASATATNTELDDPWPY